MYFCKAYPLAKKIFYSGLCPTISTRQESFKSFPGKIWTNAVVSSKVLVKTPIEFPILWFFLSAFRNYTHSITTLLCTLLTTLQPRFQLSDEKGKKEKENKTEEKGKILGTRLACVVWSFSVPSSFYNPLLLFCFNSGLIRIALALRTSNSFQVLLTSHSALPENDNVPDGDSRSRRDWFSCLFSLNDSSLIL